MATPGGQRLVVVTGASSGIGRALAQAFATAGDRVVACGRDRRRLEQLTDLLAATGYDCSSATFDVRDEREIAQAVRGILRREGTIDILVNNAGVTVFKTIAETTAKEFDDIVDTGLRAAFLMTQAVLPHFTRRGRGMIINILSYASKTTYTKSGAYSAAKAGSAALMDVLREEVRGSGISVTNVFPGATETPMWSARHRTKYRHQMMRPEVVASAVLEASLMPAGTMVEELTIRPQIGDLGV